MRGILNMQRPGVIFGLAGAWALAVLGSPGCARQARSEPGDARGITLALTVYAPQAGVRRGGQRAARYLVEPDGWLRTSVGPGSTAGVFPARTRWLDAQERAQVRALLDACTPDQSGRVVAPERFAPAPGRRTYLVEISGVDGRGAFAVGEGEPGAPAVEALADTLAAWSWVTP